LEPLVHANEVLNTRTELKNKAVMSLTSLREPELCLWVSALKAAQCVGRSWVVHAHTQPPVPLQPPPPTAGTLVSQKVESSKIKTR